MKTPEFDELNKSIGANILAPIGYEYKNGNWHYLTHDYQLSFILGKTKNSPHRQVKYLTLCLRHLDVPMGDSYAKLDPYDNLDRFCPLQISPQILEEFVNSNFSPEAWRYTTPYQNEKPIEVYQAIYYGGLDQWPMKDESYTDEDKHQFLKKSVEIYGAELISEETCKQVLEKAISNIAKYGFIWAEYMTPIEIISQIQNNGDELWIENEWIERYLQTFGDK